MCSRASQSGPPTHGLPDVSEDEENRGGATHQGPYLVWQQDPTSKLLHPTHEVEARRSGGGSRVCPWSARAPKQGAYRRRAAAMREVQLAPHPPLWRSALRLPRCQPLRQYSAHVRVADAVQEIVVSSVRDVEEIIMALELSNRTSSARKCSQLELWRLTAVEIVLRAPKPMMKPSACWISLWSPTVAAQDAAGGA